MTPALFFLSNTPEERVEALDIIINRFQFCHQRSRLREVSQPVTICSDPRL